MEPHHRRCFGIGPGGFHRQAYVEWDSGVHDAPVALCVHGLTRNARDFDFLAQDLARDRKVVCADVVGRGDSDWMRDSATYAYPNYVSDMAMLISRLGVEQVDWIGTSMGGLVGMMLTASADAPVRKMVLNDVGPFIPKAALQRIATYLSLKFEFESLDDIEAHLRKVHEPFGPLTDAQWRHLAVHSSREEGGNWRLHYDPAIAEPILAAELQDVILWFIWDAIKCPVLVIRGEYSDILPVDTAHEMTQRGPKADLITIPGVGHAPALMAEDQIAAIREWLDDGDG